MRVGVSAVLAATLLLSAAPAVLSDATVDRLTVLFVYVVLAAMWNALAGFGGLVSIGQQLFFGLGAYGTIRLADAGLDPFLAVALSALLTGLLAWPISFAMLRLCGGEFAIGMWVLAAAGHLAVNLDPLIQGETGTSLISLNAYGTGVGRLAIYYCALGAAFGLLGLLFALLRSRAGLAIQAIRDNEEAASSVGVDATRMKRLLFVLAAFGVAAAAALWLAQAISFQPKTYFSVQWTAYMMVMVLVGGIGRIEGAIFGAVLFFAVETWFAATGVWYLIGLGAAAMLFSLFLPKGIWGALEARFGLSLVPLGYRVVGGAGSARPAAALRTAIDT